MLQSYWFSISKYSKLFLPKRFSIFSFLGLEFSASRFFHDCLFSLLRSTPQRSLILTIYLKSSHKLSPNFNHPLSCLIVFLAFSTTWNYLIFTYLLSIPLLTLSRMWFYDGRAHQSYSLLYPQNLECMCVWGRGAGAVMVLKYLLNERMNQSPYVARKGLSGGLFPSHLP